MAHVDSVSDLVQLYPPLRESCRRTGLPDWEDLSHDLWLHVFEAWRTHPHSPIRDVDRYSTCMANNGARARRGAPRLVVASPDDVDILVPIRSFSVLDIIVRDEDCHAILDCVDRLPVPEGVMIWRVMAGDGVETIRRSAFWNGASKCAIDSRLRRTRQDLRDVMRRVLEGGG